MAITTGVPPTSTGGEPAMAPAKPSHAKLIPVFLWVATGAAGTLWINAHLDGGPPADEALIWLFIVAVLTAWPPYLGWRSTQRLKAALAQLQQQVDGHDGRSYDEGYAAGYLACASERFRGAN
jgi:hypothetical protein